MILANISNGLPYQHDEVCHFQSNHGHNAKCGYFRIDAMPYSAIIALLKGEQITIIDATRRHKKLTDAQKFGIPTWCLVFNRAIGKRKVKVCSWQTPEMLKVSHSDIHKPLVQSIRKLMKYYGVICPAIINENIILSCHQNFIADDNPKRMRQLLKKESA